MDSASHRTAPETEKPDFKQPSEFVTVLVTSNGKEIKYPIHKSVITYASPVFAAAFNGRFSEGQSGIMKLGEVDGATFGEAVHWMYTKEVDPNNFTCATLAKLWILAGQYLMPKLQNAAMNHLVTALKNDVDNACAAYNDEEIRNVMVIITLVYGTDDEPLDEHHILKDVIQDNLTFLQPNSSHQISKSFPHQLLLDAASILSTHRSQYWKKLYSECSTVPLSAKIYYAQETPGPKEQWVALGQDDRRALGYALYREQVSEG